MDGFQYGKCFILGGVYNATAVFLDRRDSWAQWSRLSSVNEGFHEFEGDTDESYAKQSSVCECR